MISKAMIKFWSEFQSQISGTALLETKGSY